MKKQIAFWIATCGPFGYARFGPGTLGSLIAVLFLLVGSRNGAMFTAILLGLLAAGLWSSGVVSEALNDPDPHTVIIDEVCGMMFSFILIPVRWPTLLAGFLLFRCFDIMKPPPLRSLEKFPRGLGIILDDLGAGIYANLILHLLIRYAHL